MTVFSDSGILDLILDGHLVIDPFVLDNIQPSSIDLCLDPLIKIPQDGEVIDMTLDNSSLFKEHHIDEGYTLKPGDMVLAQTFETIEIPRFCNGHIYNRSSLVRLGLDAAAASYINPGYRGKLPFRIENRGRSDIRLMPYRRMLQLEITKVDPAPIRDYSQRKDTKYFGERDNLVSLIHEDREVRQFKDALKNKETDASLTQFLVDEIHKKSKEIVGEIPESLRESLGLL